MPAARNRPKRECFNQNAALPFQLRLDDFEIADLTKYQADVYHPLNHALRGLEPVTMANLAMAKQIDSAIARAAIPRDLIVYQVLRLLESRRTRMPTSWGTTIRFWHRP